MTPQVTPHIAPVSGSQTDAVEEIPDLVMEPGVVVVLRGGPGTGRTTALEMIASRVAQRHPFVSTLRGRAGDAGEIRDQIGSLPDEVGVLLVDDADLLGEVDAAVVSAAVAQGSASVVLVVSDGPVPLAVTGLLRHRPPVVRRLAPLDATESAAFARRILGAPVAPELGAELAARTGGLPGAVAEAVSGWRDAGSLSTASGVWTATGDLDQLGRSVRSIGSEASAPPDPVEVFVALAGIVPLHILEGHVDDDALVALERRGVIEVVGEIGEEQLRLTDPDRARALVQELDPGARRRALVDLIALLDPHGTGVGPTDRITVRLARWRTELDQRLDPHAALRAGEAALRIGDLAAADELAALAREKVGSVDAVLLHAAILQRRGRLEEAHRILRSAWDVGVAPGDQLAVATRLVDTHLHMAEDAEATRRLAVELADRSADAERRRRLTITVAYVALMAGQIDLAREILEDPGPGGPEPVDAVESFVELGVRALGGTDLAGWRSPDPGDPTLIGGGGLLAVEAIRCFGLIPRLWSDHPVEIADQARSLADDMFGRRRHLAEGWAAWVESLAALFGGDLVRARLAADRAWRGFAPQGLDSRLRAVLAVLDLLDALDPSGATVETDDFPLLTANTEVPAGEIWFFRGEQLRFAALAASVEERDGAAASLAASLPELSRRGLRPASFLAECESLLLGGAPRSEGRVPALVSEAEDLDRRIGSTGAHHTAVASAAAAIATADVPALISSVDRLIGLGRLLHASIALSTAIGLADLERAQRSALLHLVERVRSTSALDPLAGHVVPQLTPAETNVARLVARGLSNREVAVELGLSKKTVDNTIASAYRRLGIDDRQALATLLAGR